MRPASAALAAAAALLLAGCPPEPDLTPVKPAGPPRTYRFRLTGPQDTLPWNETVYLAETRLGVWGVRRGVILDPDRTFKVQAREGERWSLRSELDPDPLERRVLWMIDAEGTFGSGPAAVLPNGSEVVEVEVAAPPRATVELTGDPGVSGVDVLTFADERTGARAYVVRDERDGIRYAIWDRDTWHHEYRKLVAPPRPFAWKEFAPGQWTVAARTEGRQWLALRVETRAGETLRLETLAQPEGGARVVCEEPRAELLLRGELPIPGPRLSDDVLRAHWEHVPPGRHAMRYPDGRETPFEVQDGEVRVLPRQAATREE